jgi:SAM-dependent methyltransferase
MPRIKQSVVLTLAKNIRAFFRLDAGVGFRVPDDPEHLLRVRDQHIQHLQERLQVQERELENIGPDTTPKRHGSEENPTEILKQTHALPVPDESIKRGSIFRSLVSPLKPGKMLDLGTGPGGMSLIAAELGWKVTAVDARTVRWPDPDSEDDPKTAELIRSVKWVQADVRDFPINRGEYDLICFLGLLHHLEIDDQLKLFSRCSDTLMILDARVAPEVVVTEGPYEGWYHREVGETREERDAIPHASWGNELSFFPTEESLLHMLRDSGFSKVMPMRPPHHRNYTFYLCLP